MDLPQQEWIEEYEKPVVLSPGNSSKRLHAPNSLSENPTPRCGISAESWRVSERSLHPNAEVCAKDLCEEYFSDS